MRGLEQLRNNRRKFVNPRGSWSNYGSIGPIDCCYRFEIKSTDKTFAAADFQQTVDKSAKPKIMNRPDDGYDFFFVTVNDGAAGRITVRGNGQQGKKGTMSSGVN